MESNKYFSVILVLALIAITLHQIAPVYASNSAMNPHASIQPTPSYNSKDDKGYKENDHDDKHSYDDKDHKNEDHDHFHDNTPTPTLQPSCTPVPTEVISDTPALSDTPEISEAPTPTEEITDTPTPTDTPSDTTDNNNNSDEKVAGASADNPSTLSTSTMAPTGDFANTVGIAMETISGVLFGGTALLRVRRKIA